MPSILKDVKNARDDIARVKAEIDLLRKTAENALQLLDGPNGNQLKSSQTLRGAVVEAKVRLETINAEATGRENDKYAITSPFPAELFDLAWDETIGNGSFKKQMRLHGFDAIVPGESTLVFLHEPDLGLVHYGLATRGPDGQLEVRDPAVAAREAGDEAAARAWERGFQAKATRQYQPLDAAAVEKLQAASARLTKTKNRIIDFLRRFLKECKEATERAAAAAEAERQPPAAAEGQEDAEKDKADDLQDCKAEPDVAEEQEAAGVMKESGCKRAKSEDVEDCKAEPDVKRIKMEDC
ncbi:hypothetical protein F5883DRAFT_571739 [Diaporthe sp. PMI_573]|nr:hypothetical protein F5883DRAFT_571739 [Diaporthaceae sp. PMI_573]